MHMLSALLYPKEIHLTDRFTEIAANLEDVGWSAIEHKVLLNVLKAGWDLQVYAADTKLLKKKLEDEPERLDSLPANLGRAIEFLAEHCGVLGPESLPSTYQIVALAEAARINKSEPFSSRVAEALRRWFWATGYTRYFSGMKGKQIREAIDHVRKIVRSNGIIGPCPPDLRGEEVEAIERFDPSWTRSRVFVLLLARLQPQAADGTEIDVSGLVAQSSAAVTTIFPGEPGSWPENRWLVPAGHLKKLRAYLRTLEKQGRSGSKKIRAALLLSHGIDVKARRALAAGDRQAFFAARRAYLHEREGEFVEELGLPLRWGEMEVDTRE